MAYLLDDKVYDDAAFVSSLEYGRVKWRVAAGGWTTRQVIACGVTYRECCELVIIGCLCEQCMARLMKEEALRVADYWNQILMKHEVRERQHRLAERRRERQRLDRLEEEERRSNEAADGVVTKKRKWWKIGPCNDE